MGASPEQIDKWRPFLEAVDATAPRSQDTHDVGNGEFPNVDHGADDGWTLTLLLPLAVELQLRVS